MIFGRCSFPHVLFGYHTSSLPEPCCTFRHGEETEIAFCRAEYLEAMELQRERDIAEYP